MMCSILCETHGVTFIATIHRICLLHAYPLIYGVKYPSLCTFKDDLLTLKMYSNQQKVVFRYICFVPPLLNILKIQQS